MRVLVAEDNPTILALLGEVLAEFGHNPVLASNGQEALHLWTHHAPFDALVTDWKMPRLNGDDLIACLRAEQPRLPVVVLSGYDLSDGDDADVSAQADPIAILQKPVGGQRIVEELERLAQIQAA